MRKIFMGLSILLFIFPVLVIADEKEATDSTDQLYEKAYGLYNQSKYDEAIQIFEDILKENPKHLKAQVYYGVSLMGKEDFDRAIQELTKALALDEKFPLTHYALAVSFARKKSPDAQKAQEYLDRAKKSGYRVPSWFEQYVERLKTGKILPQKEEKQKQ